MHTIGTFRAAWLTNEGRAGCDIYGGTSEDICQVARWATREEGFVQSGLPPSRSVTRRGQALTIWPKASTTPAPKSLLIASTTPGAALGSTVPVRYCTSFARSWLLMLCPASTPPSRA
jgi:hypothetical protein